MWSVTWQVVCEMCGEKGPMRGNTKTAQGQAVKRGWLTTWGPVGQAHLCPACARSGTRPHYWPRDDQPQQPAAN